MKKEVGKVYQSSLSGVFILCTNEKGKYKKTFTGVVVEIDASRTGGRYKVGDLENNWEEETFQETESAYFCLQPNKRTAAEKQFFK